MSVYLSLFLSLSIYLSFYLSHLFINLQDLQGWSALFIVHSSARLPKLEPLMVTKVETLSCATIPTTTTTSATNVPPLQPITSGSSLCVPDESGFEEMRKVLGCDKPVFFFFFTVLHLLA